MGILVMMGTRKYEGDDTGGRGARGGEKRESDGGTSRRSKLKITWKSCR